MNDLSEDEKKKQLQEKLKDHQMVFISSQYPMSASGYRTIEQIGVGMMNNAVFMAEVIQGDLSIIGQRVAIKQIDLSMQSVEFRQKITKEVQGMSLVTRSEHVVQFHCSFVHAETLWIVMDLQEGSVRDVLKCKYKNGFDDESVIAAILYQTLQGIKFLHDSDIIHRDIKAGNLLFNKEGKMKLADFGVSAILASNDEKRTTMAGTWHWMAPEVIDPSDHGGYDKKADLWSLGITCIELAYGVAPYGDARPNQVIVYIMNNPPPTLENPRTPNHAQKKFSTNFKEFVKACLQTDPKKRPTAAKLLGHRFFSQVAKEKVPDLKYALLNELPSLGERFKQQMEQKLKGLKIDPKKGPSTTTSSKETKSASRKSSTGKKEKRRSEKNQTEKLAVKEKDDNTQKNSPRGREKESAITNLSSSGEEEFSASDEILSV